MKRNTFTSEDDRQLAQRLKQSAPEAGESPWFTQRLLHRLPPKRGHAAAWAGRLCYAMAIAVCATGWVMMAAWADGSSTLTVRQALFAAVLVAATVTVVAQALTAIVRGA